jgi:hypothetical protein
MFPKLENGRRIHPFFSFVIFKNAAKTELKILLTKKTSLVLTTLLLVVGGFFVPTAGLAQGPIQLTYEVDAQVAVLGNDYSKARQLAVSQGFKSALEKALRNFLGDEKFNANRKNFRNPLKHADRYVQSYRFIEAVDDPLGKTSQVVMQVTLFPNALGSSLSNTGISVGSVSSKKVVILISEKSLTSGETISFWDVLPISEAALAQNFSEQGVNLIPRDLVKDAVSEENVLNAVNGDVGSAVQIGLKVGADIVILGNAVSSQLESQKESTESAIQTTISVRVISALTSTVIAAKSEFATARHEELLAGELEAFGDASRKLSGFLLRSLDRYWNAPSASKDVQDSQPKTPSPVMPPSYMEDL